MYLSQCKKEGEEKKKKMKKKKEKQVMEQDEDKNIESSSIITLFSEEERQVAQLLVELPTTILDLEEPLLRLLPFTWGCKKIRSAIQDYNYYYNNIPTTKTCAAPPPPPPPLPPPLHHGGAAVAPSPPPPPPCEVAASPATPLSLSLTESDDKAQKPLRWKASLKRKKEHYLKSIEDLTKSKALLNQEIDNVKRYNEQLKDFNLRLKARKEELMSEAKKTNLGIGWPMQLFYATVNSTNSMAENQQQYVTLMLNQTCGPHQICNNNNNNNNEGIAQFHYVSGHHPTTSSLPSSSPINSSSSALGMVNNSNNPNSSKNIGPHGNFDLNVTSEELVNVDPCQPLDVNGVNKDLSRVIAAQARQRRIQINRLKNNPTGNNSKTRYSYG